MLTVARYHFRATFRQRWAGYLSIVLLVGLVGGVAMGSIAGARRTQSTFPAYLAATNASNLQIQTSTVTNQFGTATLIGKLARLPHVQHVADAPYLLVIPLGPNGKALPSAFNDDDVAEVGSVGGMYFSQDRVTVTQGRMADPASTDEMVATAEAARLSGWHLGQTVPFGAYSVQQANTATFNPLTAEPHPRFSAKLVGIVVFSSQVVDDDVDRFPTTVLMTPALTRRAERERDLSHLRAPPRHGQPRRAERRTGDHRRSSSRFHLQLPSHVGGRGPSGAGDQARGDRPRRVRRHRGPGRPADRRAGHQPTVVGQPRGPRCPAIPGRRYADDGGRRHARATLRRGPRCPAGGGHRRGVLATHADRSGQSGRPVTGDRLRLDRAVVRSRGAQPRSRRPDHRPRLSREPRDATTNGGSPCGGPGWSTSPPGPGCPNPHLPVCASRSSVAAVAPPCPSARRSRAPCWRWRSWWRPSPSEAVSPPSTPTPPSTAGTGAMPSTPPAPTTSRRSSGASSVATRRWPRGPGTRSAMCRSTASPFPCC